MRKASLEKMESPKEMAEQLDFDEMRRLGGGGFFIANPQRGMMEIKRRRHKQHRSSSSLLSIKCMFMFPFQSLPNIMNDI